MKSGLLQWVRYQNIYLKTIKMIHAEINPKNLNDEIIKNLNICFPNWGDIRVFNWYFKRSISGLNSDIIIFRNDNMEIIAGSAISYREVIYNKKNAKIGIMSGSWTLPSSRGMGCFTEMVNVSLNRCDKLNIDYLTAFVTEDNKSYSRLKEAGSFCLPANNYFFDDIINTKLNENLIEISWNEFSVNFLPNYLSNNNGFFYEIENFRLQYYDRLNNVKIFLYKDKIYIVEIANILKLLLVSQCEIEDIKYVLNWLKFKYNKKIMFFSSNEFFFNELESFLDVKRGYFTILSSKNDKNISSVFNTNNGIFNIQLGDKV